MSNARFLYNYKFDTATISSSSQVSGLPDDNAVQEFVGKKWRATDCSAEWIKFDLGSAKKITMVAIFGHNLTQSTEIRLEGRTSDSGWGAGPDIEIMTWNDKAIVLFLNMTYRWWRVYLQNVGNPDGYIEIGRICAGEYVEPDVNVNENVIKKLIDPSTTIESEGRQGYAVTRDKYRVFGVEFTGIARAQQDELTDMFDTVGNTEYLCFALDPTNKPNDDTIYCKINTPIDMALGTLGNGDVSLVFEEKVR